MERNAGPNVRGRRQPLLERLESRLKARGRGPLRAVAAAPKGTELSVVAQQLAEHDNLLGS